MKEPQEDTSESTIPYNMLSLHYKHIYDIKTIKIHALANGDLLLYRDMVEELYNNVSFKIKDKEERKKIEDNFALASKHIQWGNDVGFIRARSELRQIDLSLTKYMESAGMLGHKVTWMKGFDAQRKKFKLDQNET